MLANGLKAFCRTTALVTALTGTAQAAGFYIQESSVSALGTAFAGGTSSTHNASTVYSNPAGMTQLDGPQIQVGAHLLMPESELTDTGSTFDFNGPGPGGVGPVGGGDGGNPYSPTPVPNLHVAVPLMDDNRYWFGLSITAPFGLANDYGDDWFGRFDSTATELTTINVQPSLAYKVSDWLSVGGGLDIQYADAKLESAVSNIVSEGTSRLKGDDTTVGYNFGVQLRPAEGTTIGAHYRSAINHDLNGRISVQGLTAGNFNIPGSAELSLPDILSLGVTQEVNDHWRVMAETNWYGWSNFESITARNAAGGVVSNVEQGYKNTLAFSVGTEYDVDEDWTLRLGYQYDPTPTTDEFRTSRTPDGDRNWFTAGATYNVSDRTSLDFAAVYIDVGDETINVTRNSGFAAVNADTGGEVGIISAAINYKF